MKPAKFTLRIFISITSRVVENFGSFLSFFLFEGPEYVERDLTRTYLREKQPCFLHFSASPSRLTSPPSLALRFEKRPFNFFIFERLSREREYIFFFCHVVCNNTNMEIWNECR